jgi:hypothetical protein
MWEAFIFSLGPPLINMATPTFGMPFILKGLIVAALSYVFTIAYLYYRCKYKYVIEKPGNKPKNVSWVKAVSVPSIIIAWVIAVVVLKMIAKTPITIGLWLLIKNTLALWVISFFIIYATIRASYDECYSSSMLSFW